MKKAFLILEAVCHHFEISKQELLMQRRFRHIVYPRQIAMYLLRQHSGLKRVQIGGLFGKDHTTVIHSWETIKGLSEVYEKTKRTLIDIMNVVRTGDHQIIISPYTYPGLKSLA